MSDGVTMIDQFFPFFLITDVSSKNGQPFPFDGILGLSPNVNGDQYSTLGMALPLYMEQVGKISKALVGINMFNDGTQSTLTIGNLDQK